jgi:hypothetical protein
MAIFDFDMWPVVLDEIYNQVCTNDPVLASELLSHTPSAVAGNTEVACDGCSLYHRSMAVVLWSLTHSCHCAEKLANTTTSAQELRDTDSDMMEELDRDKLSEVDQVTTPTHGAIGLDSNGPCEPGEWINLTGLGYSDTQAVEAHFKPKTKLPGIPFSAVNTSSMVKVVDWERNGDVQFCAVPP